MKPAGDTRRPVLDLSRTDGRRCTQCGEGISDYGPEAAVCGPCFLSRPGPTALRLGRSRRWKRQWTIRTHPLPPGTELPQAPIRRRRVGRMPTPLSPVCASPHLQQVHEDLLRGLAALREARGRAG